jgi:hypothetical protein
VGTGSGAGRAAVDAEHVAARPRHAGPGGGWRSG